MEHKKQTRDTMKIVGYSFSRHMTVDESFACMKDKVMF
ncbi:hypothetical protein C2W64_03984 [Brevibacillus laterosporus]|nr:hypothetical protein C2W64_03984 [Brevibacillus laterosporus]